MTDAPATITITVRASVPFAKLATWTGPCPWLSIPPPGAEFFCCGEWGGDQITRVDYTMKPATVGLDIWMVTQNLEYLEHLRDDHGFELI